MASCTDHGPIPNWPLQEQEKRVPAVKGVLNAVLATGVISLTNACNAQDHMRRRARAAGLEPEQVGMHRVGGKAVPRSGWSKWVGWHGLATLLSLPAAAPRGATQQTSSAVQLCIVPQTKT